MQSRKSHRDAIQFFFVYNRDLKKKKRERENLVRWALDAACHQLIVIIPQTTVRVRPRLVVR